MSRRKQSLFEDIAELTAKVPWWIGVLLAIVSFLILHNLAAIKVTGSLKPEEVGHFVVKQFGVTLALFGQLILPAAFILGAVISAIKNRKRGMLISNVAGNPSALGLNDMSWTEFEMLVGEFFRRRGYSVAETGVSGPDGGVDLVLKKGSETFLVQCKQWRAYKVSVQTVRELYGVMAARGAAGGYVVTSGHFTDDAKEFASGRNIELIEGKTLHAMIQFARSAWVPQKDSSQRIESTAASGTAPICPTCGAEMVKRTAKQGVYAGSEFWGCPKYPACRGTRPL